jgi:GNAT superfamily N-acetyltransferase
MHIKHLTRDEFVSCAPLEEEFRKYYIRECDDMEGWASTFGAWQDGFEDILLGAITIKIPKRWPLCCNIKLLYVFGASQGHGVGSELCQFAFRMAHFCKAEYFRVSVNPKAEQFYRKLGFKYWGRQRSGCFLSVFKVNGPEITDGLYVRDRYVDNCLTKGCLGSLKEDFNEAR